MVPAAVAQDTLTALLAEPFLWETSTAPPAVLPRPGQQLGDFGVLKVTDAGNGRVKLLLVAYDTGIFYLPANQGTNIGNGIPVKVSAPDAGTIKEYAPVKEPAFSRPAGKSYPWLVLTAIAVVLLAGLLYRLRKRRAPLPQPLVITGEGGLELLNELKQNWASGKLNSRQLGEALVNCLQVHFGIRVKKSTRQLAKLVKSNYADAWQPGLDQVLRNTDAWRFGKQEALAGEAESAAAFMEELFLKTGTKANT